MLTTLPRRCTDPAKIKGDSPSGDAIGWNSDKARIHTEPRVPGFVHPHALDDVDRLGCEASWAAEPRPPHGLPHQATARLPPRGSLCYDAHHRAGRPPSVRDHVRPGTFRQLLDAARSRRAQIVNAPDVTAHRLLDGVGDGVAGVYLDRYGPALVMQVYEDARLSDEAITSAARTAFEVTRPSGVESVYVKPFARDRSRLGGQAPDESRAPSLVSDDGNPRRSSFVSKRAIRGQTLRRLLDGTVRGSPEPSPGTSHTAARPRPQSLRLHLRVCRAADPGWGAGHQRRRVDRYLDWGEKNLILNGIEPASARFFRMDAFEFLAYAARHAEERFDLVILDPPTFAAGDRRRGVKTWKAVEHYPALVQAAARVLTPNGWCLPRRTHENWRQITRWLGSFRTALGSAPAWQSLPPMAADVTEAGRVAALLFAP